MFNQFILGIGLAPFAVIAGLVINRPTTPPPQLKVPTETVAKIVTTGTVQLISRDVGLRPFNTRHMAPPGTPTPPILRAIRNQKQWRQFLPTPP